MCGCEYFKTLNPHHI
eukprot:UN09099